MAAEFQALGVGPGSHVGILGPDHPPARHRHPGDLARGRHARRPPAADAALLDRGVRAPDPCAPAQSRHHPAPHRPRAGGLRRAGRRRSTDDAPRRSRRGRGRSRCRQLRAPHRRPRSVGHPPVHQRLHVRAQGRDAARARALREPRRHRRSRPAASRRRVRVLAAALPRHGFGRHAHRAHDDRSEPRARCAAGLPRVAGALAAMALRLPRHGHGRPQLLVGARHPRPATHGRPRPLAHAHRAQRSRTGRSRHRRGLHRRGRPFRHASRSRVPRLRHGRGVDRRRLPRSAHRPAHRFGRSQGSRIRALRRARRSARLPTRARSPCSAGRARTRRCGSSIPPPAGSFAIARSASSRSAAPRSRPATTRTPRRRRPRSATTGFAPAISPTCSTASLSCAGASRTSSSSAAATCFPKMSSAPSPRSRACAPATSSRSASTAARGKEHLVVVAETKSETHDELRRQVHHRATEAAGAPPHDIVLVSAGTSAQDIERQAPAQPVSSALPRRRAAARLTA